MRWLPALLAALLAGCATSSPVIPDEEPEPVPVVLEDAVAAYAAGNQSANLDVVGRFENTGEEVDAWEDYLFLDAGGSIRILRQAGTNGTWALEEVATVAVPGPKDVKVSDDGQWMFVGNDEQASVGPLAGNQRLGGFYTYFVGDKAAPERTHYLAVGPTRGPHMVFYHQQADGTELVFGANGDVSINAFDRETGTLSELARYAPNYVTDVNRDPMVLDAYYQVYAHDMFVMEDNRTQQTLMYVANWDAGLRIVDVTQPASPQELGAWNDFPEGHSGNLHTVATEWIGDRRITVGAVEVGFAVVGGIPYATNNERSVVYVWDTTDSADIRLLGQWENPDGLPAGRTEMGEDLHSTHNLQIEAGLVYLAHYDLGVFVLDVRTPELQAAPAVVAYHKAGHTWDVVISQGAVVTSGTYGLLGLESPLLQGGEVLFSRA